MVRLGQERKEICVVNNQIGSPTYARDLAFCILEILPKLNNAKTQIFHYANTGKISWYEFACQIMQEVQLDCKVIPIASKQFPTKAPRPKFSLLDTSKVKRTFDIEIPLWQDSFKKCLKILMEK